MPPTPVPSLPTCDMPRVAVFRPGLWNGKEYDRNFLKTLYDNFKKFSGGSDPWFRPYLSINHDKFPHLAGFRFGQLANPHLDRDGTLYFDATGVPVEVGQLIKTGMLREPSIEFVEPKRDATGRPVSGFTDRAGNIVDGPVVKCLTLIGNDVPGVKGLPPLPDPVMRDRVDTKTFSSFGGILRRFGATTMQTRDQILAALTAAGLDVSTLTDAVPDEFLSAILAFIQGQNANPTSETPPTAQMADAVIGSPAVTIPQLGTPTPAGTPGAGPVPSQVVLKFNQQYPGMLGLLQGTIATLQRHAEGVSKITTKALADAKENVITGLFRDCGIDGTGQITPAMQPGIRLMLLPLDHIDTKKFADGKASGTALEEACATIKATYPAQGRSGHRTQQTDPTRPGSDGAPLDATRRARILGGSPLGRTVLKPGKN